MLCLIIWLTPKYGPSFRERGRALQEVVLSNAHAIIVKDAGEVSIYCVNCYSLFKYISGKIEVQYSSGDIKTFVHRLINNGRAECERFSCSLRRASS